MLATNSFLFSLTFTSNKYFNNKVFFVLFCSNHKLYFSSSESCSTALRWWKDGGEAFGGIFRKKEIVITVSMVEWKYVDKKTYIFNENCHEMGDCGNKADRSD